MVVDEQLFFIVANFIIAFAGGLMAIRISNKFKLLRAPNERDSHKLPTARSGAVGMIAILCFTMAWYDWKMASLAVLIMGFVGFIDDVKDLPPKFKFAGQLIAVGFLLFALPLNQIKIGNWQFQEFAILIYILWIILILWWVNLFNFMDGINGIALIQSASMLMNIIILQTFGNQAVSPILLCAIMGNLGLLMLNITGRVFMGDVGSLALGLFTIIMMINYSNDWALLAILGAVFWVDATLCLIVRVINGSNPIKAHRSHIYQKLAKHYDSHFKITRGVGVYNLAYILPILYFYQKSPDLFYLWISLAYLPLIFIGWCVKVGLDDTK